MYNNLTIVLTIISTSANTYKLLSQSEPEDRTSTELLLYTVYLGSRETFTSHAGLDDDERTHAPMDRHARLSTALPKYVFPTRTSTAEIVDDTYTAITNDTHTSLSSSGPENLFDGTKDPPPSTPTAIDDDDDHDHHKRECYSIRTIRHYRLGQFVVVWAFLAIGDEHHHKDDDDDDDNWLRLVCKQETRQRVRVQLNAEDVVSKDTSLERCTLDKVPAVAVNLFENTDTSWVVNETTTTHFTLEYPRSTLEDLRVGVPERGVHSPKYPPMVVVRTTASIARQIMIMIFFCARQKHNDRLYNAARNVPTTVTNSIMQTTMRIIFCGQKENRHETHERQTMAEHGATAAWSTMDNDQNLNFWCLSSRLCRERGTTSRFVKKTPKPASGQCDVWEIDHCSLFKW
ncbi:hypothetical protein E2986_10859 [Frieseomelitta varia]|uniref:Uncharacterized protein n=1 Tax=Frieseomelitta varia TaxID=561572 RepID=A0A833WA12_9HYME|nr:hypothetical protein E2986_10859 [Frieseomelitta varia]